MRKIVIAQMVALDGYNATMRFGEIETLRDKLLMEMERLIW